MYLSPHEFPNMVGKKLCVNQGPHTCFQDIKVVHMLYVRNVLPTFQVLSGQEDSSQMMILNQGTNLRRDFRSIKSHDETLSHCPIQSVC